MLALLESEFFCLGARGRYAGVVDGLRYHDPYMVCADFDSFVAAMGDAAALYRAARLGEALAPQHRRRGRLLQRRDHPRLRARHLGHRAGQGPARRAIAASLREEDPRFLCAVTRQLGPWHVPRDACA